MAKVYLDEINAVLSSNVFSVLNSDSTDANSLKATLLEFSDYSSDELKGTQWDNYRGMMSQFSELMTTRSSLANQLSSAIREALELLRDYMGDDWMLDSSKIDEYKRQKMTCENSISTLRRMLNETITENVTNADGTTSSRTVPLYNSYEIQRQISLASETLTELDRLITKLEGLDPVYRQAESILFSAFSKIDGFKSSGLDIVPDGKYQYYAA